MDIIFFAAVAIFIFLKLRAQLGKVDEEQKRDSIKKFIKEQTKLRQNQPTLVAIPGVGIVDANAPNQIDEKSQKILDNLSDPVKSDFIAAIKQANISAFNFLDGATKAFEMVLVNFSSANLPVLKSLLSEKIFAQFENSVKQRQASGQNLITRIVAIDKAQVTNAKLVDNFAIITVQFNSRQINYITNNASEVIEGNKTDIDNISDNWTFKKDCNSSNPNWLVIATS